MLESTTADNGLNPNTRTDQSSYKLFYISKLSNNECPEYITKTTDTFLVLYTL